MTDERLVMATERMNSAKSELITLDEAVERLTYYGASDAEKARIRADLLNGKPRRSCYIVCEIEPE